MDRGERKKRGFSLYIEVGYKLGSFFYKFEPGFRIFSHQILKFPIGIFLFVHGHSDEGSGILIHRGFFKVGGGHLTQSFKSSYVMPGSVEYFNDPVFLLLIQCIVEFFSRVNPVKGRLGNV